MTSSGHDIQASGDTRKIEKDSKLRNKANIKQIQIYDSHLQQKTSDDPADRLTTELTGSHQLSETMEMNSSLISEESGGPPKHTRSSLSIKQYKIGPDDFTPLRLLGKGSFGEVFMVREDKTNDLYAMKVLSKVRIMGQNLIRYAKTERDVLSYTKHPFIVSLNAAF